MSYPLSAASCHKRRHIYPLSTLFITSRSALQVRCVNNIMKEHRREKRIEKIRCAVEVCTHRDVFCPIKNYQILYTCTICPSNLFCHETFESEETPKGFDVSVFAKAAHLCHLISFAPVTYAINIVVSYKYLSISLG